MVDSPKIQAFNLADIQGNSHHVVRRQTKGAKAREIRPIVVSGDGSTIINQTEYPVTLLPSASGNRVTSLGKVTDQGKDNEVTEFDPAKTNAEAK